ncbi:UNVERIFIED_CONTAM: dipeptidase, partial [Bifidobacterium animalis subsp. lactis]
PLKFAAVRPEDPPRHYRGVISHLEIDLPGDPCLYSIVPNVRPTRGVLAEAGVNEHNVAMSATETIAVNSRALAADPLVKLVPAHGEPGDADYREEVPGGVGEEDIITLVLPYVRTACGAVARIRAPLATFGNAEAHRRVASTGGEIRV